MITLLAFSSSFILWLINLDDRKYWSIVLRYNLISFIMNWKIFIWMQKCVIEYPLLSLCSNLLIACIAYFELLMYINVHINGYLFLCIAVRKYCAKMFLNKIRIFSICTAKTSPQNETTIMLKCNVSWFRFPRILNFTRKRHEIMWWRKCMFFMPIRWNEENFISTFVFCVLIFCGWCFKIMEQHVKGVC